jgi:hypothetical protein
MTIGTILLCIGAALVLGLIVFLAVLKIRSIHFHPSPDKEAQQAQLNRDLKEAGFAYDRKSDIFYSLTDCWQREMGYCQLYDEGSSTFNMVMHCEPIRFSYAGKRWLIELWKGQYGITTGAEIGIYNTEQEDVSTERFTGPFYECASDPERIRMSFVLRKNGRILFKRRALHWWLTGFKLGEFSSPDSLTMDAFLYFPNRQMCDAFLEGLLRTGYQKGEYSVRGHCVTIHFKQPHSSQPLSHGSIQEAAAQKMNETNCFMYRQVTAKYKNTLDKLEYLKALAPQLYEFCMHSLYAKAFYEGFDWLLELIRHHKSEPKPHPPVPDHCPPCSGLPCPPHPCCTPEPCTSNPCFPVFCGSRSRSSCRRPNRLCLGDCEGCPYRRESCTDNSSDMCLSNGCTRNCRSNSCSHTSFSYKSGR